MNNSVYTEDWWKNLLQDQAEPVSNFGPDAEVYSEMIVRKIVIDAIANLESEINLLYETMRGQQAIIELQHSTIESSHEAILKTMPVSPSDE